MNIRWLAMGGALAGALLVSGVATADIPDSGVFHACVREEGSLRLLDTTVRATCRKGELAVSWNATGPAGPQGPAGPPGPAGSPGPAGPPGPAGGSASVLMNRNFEDVPTNAQSGVSVAHLDLAAGTWVLQAKLRYRNDGTLRQTSACVFQGVGVGGLDGSQQNVDPGGEFTGQSDGVLMDIAIKRPGDSPDVHVQCFGPTDGSIHIVNALLLATLPNSLILR